VHREFYFIPPVRSVFLFPFKRLVVDSKERSLVNGEGCTITCGTPICLPPLFLSWHWLMWLASLGPPSPPLVFRLKRPQRFSSRTLSRLWSYAIRAQHCLEDRFSPQQRMVARDSLSLAELPPPYISPPHFFFCDSSLIFCRKVTRGLSPYHSFGGLRKTDPPSQKLK